MVVWLAGWLAGQADAGPALFEGDFVYRCRSGGRKFRRRAGPRAGHAREEAAAEGEGGGGGGRKAGFQTRQHGRAVGMQCRDGGQRCGQGSDVEGLRAECGRKKRVQRESGGREHTMAEGVRCGGEREGVWPRAAARIGDWGGSGREILEVQAKGARSVRRDECIRRAACVRRGRHGEHGEVEVGRARRGH